MGINEIVGKLLTVSEQSLKHFLVGLRLENDVCVERGARLKTTTALKTS